MVDQVRSTGALDYSAFYSDGPTAYREDHGDIPLYQAQHGDLYYWLMRPVFEIVGGIGDLPQSISALRSINLLLTAGALAVFLWTISWKRYVQCGAVVRSETPGRYLPA